MGACTSQVLASHLYLDGLDHYIKRVLKVPGYVHYVDDCSCSPTAAPIWSARPALIPWLEQERGLRLKPPQAPILPPSATLDALGHRIDRDGLRPRPRALRALRADVVRAVVEGKLGAMRAGMPARVGGWMFGAEVVPRGGGLRQDGGAGAAGWRRGGG